MIFFKFYTGKLYGLTGMHVPMSAVLCLYLRQLFSMFAICFYFRHSTHKRYRGWERIEKIESRPSSSVHQTFVVASQVLREWMKWEHFQSRFSSHSFLPALLWKAMHQLREMDQLGDCSPRVTRAWIFCMTDCWDIFLLFI